MIGEGGPPAGRFWRKWILKSADPGRGEPIRNMQRKSKPVEPLAAFTEDSDLVWNDHLAKK